MTSLRVAVLATAVSLTAIFLASGVSGALPTADPPPKVAFAPVRLYPLPGYDGLYDELE
jgi:hypothetical protein